MASEAGNGGSGYTAEEQRVAMDVVALLVAAERYVNAAHTYMQAEDIESGDWEHPMVKELWSAIGGLCVVAIGVSRRYEIVVKDEDA